MHFTICFFIFLSTTITGDSCSMNRKLPTITEITSMHKNLVLLMGSGETAWKIMHPQIVIIVLATEAKERKDIQFVNFLLKIPTQGTPTLKKRIVPQETIIDLRMKTDTLEGIEGSKGFRLLNDTRNCLDININAKQYVAVLKKGTNHSKKN